MAKLIRLEDLAHAVPALDAVAAAFHQANCMMCMDDENHASGVEMEVEFNNSKELVSVIWEGFVTPQMARVYADRNKRVDFGACAIALLLIPAFTEYIAIAQSATGNGIDYFLQSADADDELIFNTGAYLEVSGIQSETTANTISDRIQSKRRRLQRQAKALFTSASDLPTYICVVEFSRPEAKVVVS